MKKPLAIASLGRHGWLLLTTCLALWPADVPLARQFRYLAPIAAPAASPTLPPGVKPIANVTPIPRAQVETALTKVISAWNSQQLADKLGENFYDKSRLLDALDSKAPRDATLRLQSVQGVQTLQQFTRPDPAHAGAEQLVSRVSVTARTQVEFTATDGTFTRRAGVNEFILRITQSEQAAQ